MLTRGGVCYNLEKTPFNLELDYQDTKIIYRFSAKYNLDNFVKQLKENREKINGSLSKRFGFEIENNKLCDLKLYQRIEKRGFLIENEEIKYKCLSNIRLNGHNKILTNLIEL